MSNHVKHFNSDCLCSASSPFDAPLQNKDSSAAGNPETKTDEQPTFASEAYQVLTAWERIIHWFIDLNVKNNLGLLLDSQCHGLTAYNI